MSSSRRVVSARTYRAVDAITKLAGVALVAAGLQAGIGTTTGVALAAVGAAFGVCTVFISPTHD